MGATNNYGDSYGIGFVSTEKLTDEYTKPVKDSVKIIVDIDHDSSLEALDKGVAIAGPETSYAVILDYLIEQRKKHLQVVTLLSSDVYSDDGVQALYKVLHTLYLQKMGWLETTPLPTGGKKFVIQNSLS
jgi:hypothetical protein